MQGEAQWIHPSYGLLGITCVLQYLSVFLCSSPLILHQFVASEISECQTLPLQIIPLNSSSTFTGVGPYYMFAFEPEGIPTVSLIGSDPKNLSWQNTHKSGTSHIPMLYYVRLILHHRLLAHAYGWRLKTEYWRVLVNSLQRDRYAALFPQGLPYLT